MNRIGLKQASKLSLSETDSRPVATTFIYLIIIYLVDALSTTISTRILPLSDLVNDALYNPDAYVQTIINLVFSMRYTIMYLVTLLISLLIEVFNAGYANYTLKLSRRTATGFGDVVSAVNLSGKIIWLSILIWFFTSLWTLLFIIPGIVASYRYRMAYYALLDNPDMTAREALNVSKAITRGHKMSIFVLDLSFIGWYLLAGLTFGIVLIWKLPYIETTYAHTYNWLVSINPTGYSQSNYLGPDIV